MLPCMCLVGLEHAPPNPAFPQDVFNSMTLLWSEILASIFVLFWEWTITLSFLHVAIMLRAAVM